MVKSHWGLSVSDLKYCKYYLDLNYLFYNLNCKLFIIAQKDQSNEVNETLLKNITDEGKIFMVPSKINDVYFLRFAICAASTEKRHVDFAWEVIQKHAETLLIAKH